MSRRHRVGDEGGFTLIEVLVASMLLIVGAFATFALLDRGAQATGSSLQRDRGNALALEVIERATGMRYTRDVNDLVASDAPARLRRAIDPDLSGDSTEIAPVAEPAGHAVQSSRWTVTRAGTAYTVTYRACTTSDTVRGTVIRGPLDCDRPSDDGDITQPPVQVPATNCSLGLGLLGLGHQTPVDPDDPEVDFDDVTVRLQLLGPLVNVELCLEGVIGGLGLGLVSPLCDLLGPSSLQSLLGSSVPSALNGLLGVLTSGADLGLCRTDDVRHELVDVTAGVAATTHIEASVSWEDPRTGRTETLKQDAAVRRGGHLEAGAGA
ncbi:MAG: hypothetical protein M0P31_06740 [Solirubrobacteraceae bacterium]|nr:hypothetical protein [Solirubrobacteraceae bacterium]